MEFLNSKNVFVLIFTLNFFISFTSGSTYHRLHRDLFRMYSKIIPISENNNPIEVSMHMTIVNIANVDETRNEINLEAWTFMSWDTPALRWSPEEYDNITAIRVPRKRLWVPDITLYNGVQKFENAEEEDFDNAVVDHNGHVLWVPKVNIRALCDVESQRIGQNVTCILKFGSWAYHGFLIDLSDSGQGVDLGGYFQGSKYVPLEASVKRNVLYYSCCPEPYVDLTFGITFVEKSKIKKKGYFEFFKSFF